MARVSIDGKVLVLQLLDESDDGVTKVQVSGSVVDVVLRSPKEHKLAMHMLPPPVVDTSNMVLSPMPGKLISYNVAVGDSVEMGQELCVVEAMKMQNVMRSDRKGVIKSVNAAEGDNLKVDQVLIEFDE